MARDNLYFHSRSGGWLLRGLTATVASFAVLGAASAHAAITTVTPDAAGATAIANAIKHPTTNVTGASFAPTSTLGIANGTANAPIGAGFPTNGGTFGIITSGNVQLADDANASESSGADAGNADLVRGNTDSDVTVLKIDLNVPAGSNCLSLNFRFLSEEFPEYVGSGFNDGFIAELDNSTWSTNGSTISAPDNFAFDSNGNVVSINSSGPTAMNAANAAGTTYDGATALLAASTQVTPGAHSLYLSIFDQGDNFFDSAAFLDALVIGFVPNPEAECSPGAAPVLGRMVGEGRLTSGGQTADYAYVLGCALTDPDKKLQVKVGGTTYTLAAVSEVSCTDAPGVTPSSGSGFDTMTGKGTTAGGVLIEWTFVDGGPASSGDTAYLKLSSGSTVIFEGSGSPPGSFGGGTRLGRNTAQPAS